MNSTGLKMYGDDYGNSSDDGRPDEVPNSGSVNDTPHQAAVSAASILNMSYATLTKV